MFYRHFENTVQVLRKSVSETCQQPVHSQSISEGKLSGFVGRKIGVNLLPSLFHLILFQRWQTHHSLIYKRWFNINEHPAAISQTLPKTVFIGFGSICNQIWRNPILFYSPFALLSPALIFQGCISTLLYRETSVCTFPCTLIFQGSQGFLI